VGGPQGDLDISKETHQLSLQRKKLETFLFVANNIQRRTQSCRIIFLQLSASEKKKEKKEPMWMIFTSYNWRSSYISYTRLQEKTLSNVIKGRPK
jgi:uncharacterized protein YecE (DUF72 family)